jgi:hypothetical protein
MFFRTREQSDNDNEHTHHASPTDAQRCRDTVAIRSTSGNEFDANPPTLAVKINVAGVMFAWARKCRSRHAVTSNPILTNNPLIRQRAGISVAVP